MSYRVTGLLVAGLAVASTGYAQPSPRFYAGGSFTAFTQTHSADEPLGGTTSSVSGTFGGWLSPRVGLEFESTFGGTFSSSYSYLFAPSLSADVVTSRRDMFFAVQFRARAAGVEPVVGVAFAHASLHRHATTGSGQPYFDDEGASDGVAPVLGLDVPVRVAGHLEILPTVRMLISLRPSADMSSSQPLDAQTSTGAVVFRYGIGARVTF